MDRKIKIAKLFATVLDSQFEFAGIKFGLDPIINLIPFLGNFIGTALSFYILKIGREIGVSNLDLFRMILNIFLDFLVGAVPFVGIVFDVVVKANIKNIKILEKYQNKTFQRDKIIEGQIIS